MGRPRIDHGPAPKCPICGEPVKWSRSEARYHKYCSRECWNKALSLLCGVPMERALTPAQCAEMRRFLRLCLTAGRKARELGGRVDVMELIRQWREGQWEQPRVADRSAWVELVEQGLSLPP